MTPNYPFRIKTPGFVKLHNIKVTIPRSKNPASICPAIYRPPPATTSQCFLAFEIISNFMKVKPVIWRRFTRVMLLVALTNRTPLTQPVRGLLSLMTQNSSRAKHVRTCSPGICQLFVSTCRFACDVISAIRVTSSKGFFF